MSLSRSTYITIFGLTTGLLVAVAIARAPTIQLCLARFFNEIHQMGLVPNNPYRTSSRSIEESTWIGYSEADIRKMFGRPIREVAEYEAVGLKAKPVLSGPYKTLIYEHPEGYLFVWLNDPGYGFVCFESLWFNHDVKF